MIGWTLDDFALEAGSKLARCKLDTSILNKVVHPGSHPRAQQGENGARVLVAEPRGIYFAETNSPMSGEAVDACIKCRA